jgi:hypothetical protein
MAKHGPEAVADPDNFEAPGQTKGRLLPATAPPCSWQSRIVAVVASGDLVTASARPCSAWRRPPLAGYFWPDLSSITGRLRGCRLLIYMPP